MKDEEKVLRFDILKSLKEVHPAILQNINPKIAYYTGGMKDDGGLNWNYCLYDCPFEDLLIAYGEVEKK